MESWIQDLKYKLSHQHNYYYGRTAFHLVESVQDIRLTSEISYPSLLPPPPKSRALIGAKLLSTKLIEHWLHRKTLSPASCTFSQCDEVFHIVSGFILKCSQWTNNGQWVDTCVQCPLRKWVHVPAASSSIIPLALYVGSHSQYLYCMHERV